MYGNLPPLDPLTLKTDLTTSEAGIHELEEIMPRDASGCHQRYGLSAFNNRKSL